MIRIEVALAAMVAITCGCKKSEAPAEAPATPAEVARAESSPGAGPKLKTFHLDALKSVPATALMVASVDVGWTLSTLIDHNLGLLPVMSDVTKLRGKVSRQSTRYFGFDLLQAKRAILWIAPMDEAWAVVIEGPFEGTPKGRKTKDIKGTKAARLDRNLYGAIADGKLIFGSEKGIELALVKGGGLDKEGLAVHAKALDSAGDGSTIITAHVGPLGKELPKMARGLQAAALSAGTDGTISLAVVGSQDALDKLLSMYEAGLRQVRNLLDEKLAEAEEDEEGALAILMTIGQAKLEDLAAVLPVAIEKDVLVARSLIKGGFFASYAGIMSAVAVPAFIKYTRRAKTTEAIDQLDKIYKASSYYYTSPMVERGTGNKIDCQFPASQGMTPDVTGQKCCGGINDADKDDRCDVNTALWTTDTWSALNFQMNDQHYFGYEYVSSGTLSNAKFTASAYADLDCDGVLSTFQRYGYGDETASKYECSMKGSSAFYKNLETE